MANAMAQGSQVLSSSNDKGFDYTDRDFHFIVKFIGEHAGIVMTEAKRDLIYGRLTSRLRALKLSSFSEYIDILKGGDSDEIENFVNALTTNLTSFFREQHHFDHLQKDLLPDLIQNKQSRTLRVWSAGCSTGEEPYSIAMTISEALPSGWDFRLLATDLDTKVVNTAARGIYKQERIEGISQHRLQRWFQKGTGSNAGMVKVSSKLQDLITFKQLNLLSDWPMKGNFDIIFCRNVVIYFDKPTQSVLFDRFANQLEADGHLFIGHSETLHNVTERFSLLGHTIYHKIE